MVSTTIKSGTIKCYLRASSSILLNHKQIDPLLDTRGVKAHCIKDVFSEVKRCESMSNVREDVTFKMAFYMHEKCKSKYPGSLYSVLFDWDVLGIFCWFHLSY